MFWPIAPIAICLAEMSESGHKADGQLSANSSQMTRVKQDGDDPDAFKASGAPAKVAR